jgi:glycogen debranching enzyme
MGILMRKWELRFWFVFVVFEVHLNAVLPICFPEIMRNNLYACFAAAWAALAIIVAVAAIVKRSEG